jgi:hypothetical protein
VAANVSVYGRESTLCDADFVHFRGLRTLDMSGCSDSTITDAAFAHLRGIHTLIMSGCFTITDAAFAHLRGIHTLDMRVCRQNTITAACRARLAQAGIPDLRMLRQ